MHPAERRHGQTRGVDAVQALERLGGVGDHASVVALSSRGRLRRAVRTGRVLHAGRDRYVLPTAREAQRAAARLHGVVSHLGAAAHWGWEIASPPEQPHVSVRRNRKIDPERASGVQLHWTTWREGDLRGLVTSPLRTVLDCARDLPFHEALAVADSALRHGDVTGTELLDATALLRGPGSRRARRVAAHADGRAANPFESVLRAIAVEEGWDVVCQHPVDLEGFTVHPDVAAPARRVALEAESWEHHGRRRRDFERDCGRYNALVLAGWLVLRFTWAQVMQSPAYVRRVLRGLDAGPPGRAQAADTPSYAA